LKAIDRLVYHILTGFTLPKGIDAIENVINRSLVSIANSETHEKARAEEITNEPDKRSKLQRFHDFVGENAGWIELVANVVRASLTGG
jgi:hypothetical protein